MNNGKYNLEGRLLKYSIAIVKFVATLPNNRVGNHIANQILRSGTSPYPNHGEARAAESVKDFIHKIRIGLKELRETKCWLTLIEQLSITNPEEQLKYLMKETEELIKIFVSSIRTASKKNNNS